MREKTFRAAMRELKKTNPTPLEQQQARDALMAYALEWIGDVAEDLELPGAPRGVRIGPQALVVTAVFVDVLPGENVKLAPKPSTALAPSRFTPSLVELLDGLIAWMVDRPPVTPRAHSALTALKEERAKLPASLTA